MSSFCIKQMLHSKQTKTGRTISSLARFFPKHFQILVTSTLRVDVTKISESFKPTILLSDDGNLKAKNEFKAAMDKY